MTSDIFPIDDHVMFSDNGVVCLEEFPVLDRLVVSCLESFRFHPVKWQVKLRRA